MTGTNICSHRFEQRKSKPNDISSISLDTLIFHVTGSCNLKCRHCWQSANLDEKHNTAHEKINTVTTKAFSGLLKDAKSLGLGCVKFTGGEPFLHPRIMEYIEVVDREGLSVGIETNGTLIEAEYVKKLKDIEHLFIAVSLDGASAVVHDRFRGVSGAFDRAITAIQRLTGAEISVQIIMSLYRENVKDLAGIIKLAEDYRVRSIKINPVQPMGRGRDLLRQGDALSVAELLDLAEYCNKTLNPDFEGELSFSLPLAFQSFSDIQHRKFSLCQILQILGLMPNGDLSFCGIGNIARAMVIGNIYQDKLADLWYKAPLLVDLRQRLPMELKGVCSRCILKTICLGQCRAHAFDQSRDLMTAYWICQEAFELGLFPVSRLSPDVREREPAGSEQVRQENVDL